MNVVFVTGSHPRHAFIARALADTGYLAGLVIEEREAHIPEPPSDLNEVLTQLFVEHFAQRESAEKRFFGDSVFPDVPTLRVSKEELNGVKTQKFLSDISPELLLSYGCHRLTEESLAKVKGEKWNIHGGLSPWYRGAITHFWPSYMLEPQMTGMTVHELTQQLDAGAIVHQCKADLVRGDGVHDLAARAVVKIAQELPLLLNKMTSGIKIEKVKQKSAGKLWLGADWRPEHLLLVYCYFDNRIVDAYLDGKIVGKEPELVRQI